MIGGRVQMNEKRCENCECFDGEWCRLSLWVEGELIEKRAVRLTDTCYLFEEKKDDSERQND